MTSVVVDSRELPSPGPACNGRIRPQCVALRERHALRRIDRRVARRVARHRAAVVRSHGGCCSRRRSASASSLPARALNGCPRRRSCTSSCRRRPRPSSADQSTSWSKPWLKPAFTPSVIASMLPAAQRERLFQMCPGKRGMTPLDIPPGDRVIVTEVVVVSRTSASKDSRPSRFRARLPKAW